MPITKDDAALHPSINTISGELFFYDEPDRNLGPMDIYTLAHSLGNLCRFTGHCTGFYSVAEHSILVSRWLGSFGSPEPLGSPLRLGALLHEAAESVIGDINSPLKSKLRSIIKPIENAFLDVIDRQYLVETRTPEIKRADTALYLLEREHIMPPLSLSHPEHHYIPLNQDFYMSVAWFRQQFKMLQPSQAAQAFMSEYIRITKGR